MPDYHMTTCQHCGREWAAGSPEARYCTGRCRVAAHRARRRQEETGVTRAGHPRTTDPELVRGTRPQRYDVLHALDDLLDLKG